MESVYIFPYHHLLISSMYPQFKGSFTTLFQTLRVWSIIDIYA